MMRRLMLKRGVLVSVMLPLGAALACGPYFPPSYLPGRSGRFYLSLRFEHELGLIASQFEVGDGASFHAVGVSTREADMTDVRNRLANLPFTPEKRRHWLEKYATCADAVRAGEDVELPRFPSELDEFLLYLRGVRELNQMEAEKRTGEPASWKKLLALPLKKRPSRTSWVLYMLGNVALSQGRCKDAEGYYDTLRRQVADGLADSLGLAHASYKTQFRGEKRPVERFTFGIRAWEYYRRTGDEERANEMLWDLEYLAMPRRWSAEQQTALVRNPLAREMQAARVLARFGGSSEKLLDALGDAEVREGERLAVVAYSAGRFEECRRWLEKTSDDSILKSWLQAKLCRHDGDYEAAAVHLRQWLTRLQSAEEVPGDRFRFRDYEGYLECPFSRVVQGMLGAVLVHRSDFMEALNCFLLAGAWQDAASVAEDLVSIGDLQTYVDATCGEAAVEGSKTEEQYPEGMPVSEKAGRAELRHLLARRLIRAGKLAEAIPYVPASLRPAAQRLQVHLCRAEAPALTADSRAVQLYNAAKIMRWYGMELFGTELSPDFAIVGGTYSYCGVNPNWFQDTPGIEARGEDKPQQRFHYRLLAAETAWRAAELADSRDLQAVFLYAGGDWLKSRHPEEADRFYKRLARIPGHPLAAAAARDRWFPRDVSRELADEVESSKGTSVRQVVDISQHAIVARETP